MSSTRRYRLVPFSEVAGARDKSPHPGRTTHDKITETYGCDATSPPQAGILLKL